MNRTLLGTITNLCDNMIVYTGKGRTIWFLGMGLEEFWKKKTVSTKSEKIKKIVVEPKGEKMLTFSSEKKSVSKSAELPKMRV